MTAITARLHAALLEPLSHAVEWHSPVGEKPLSVDLSLPNPPRLRVYMYTLVSGGVVRPSEYKAVLRVRGQQVGKYGSFDHSGGRLAMLVAYRADLDVFVLWDASLHPRFKNGGNVQVRDYTVHEAAALGRANLRRPLASGVVEVVIACQSWNLLDAIRDRVAWTGGIEADEARQP
jgi:restriction-modification system family protein